MGFSGGRSLPLHPPLLSVNKWIDPKMQKSTYSFEKNKNIYFVMLVSPVYTASKVVSTKAK